MAVRKPDVAVVCQFVESVAYISDGFAQIYFLHFQFGLLYFAEVQNLIDQPQHPVGVFRYGFQMSLGMVGDLLVCQQKIHRSRYHGQRSPDLVRYVGEKTQFHVRQLFFNLYVFFQSVECEKYM